MKPSVEIEIRVQFRSVSWVPKVLYTQSHYFINFLASHFYSRNSGLCWYRPLLWLFCSYSLLVGNLSLNLYLTQMYFLNLSIATNLCSTWGSWTTRLFSHWYLDADLSSNITFGMFLTNLINRQPIFFVNALLVRFSLYLWSLGISRIYLEVCAYIHIYIYICFIFIFYFGIVDL